MSKYWYAKEDTRLGKFQRRLESKSSCTFCVLPWIHLATRPNGDMRLCCTANASGAGDNHTVGLIKNKDGSHANFGKVTPMEAWNSDFMKNVRNTMLAGEIPASCTGCFDEESQGISASYTAGSMSIKANMNEVENMKGASKDNTETLEVALTFAF